MSSKTRSKLTAAVAGISGFALMLSGCSSNNEGSTTQDGKVILEFAQWWAPELPDGSLRKLMDDFEKENPNIKVKLLSGPFTTTKEQLVAGAASGTMPDVVGLDGTWVNDFAKQGAIADLDKVMADNKYDNSKVASQIKVKNKTYMVTVANFAYPMFTNDDLLKKAGISTPPSNRTEFAEVAKKIHTTSPSASGWIIPLSLDLPNGIRNDLMPWVWASGGSMLTKDGKPNVNNPKVKEVVEYLKKLWDDGLLAKGAFTMKEQDKIEEFTNGRVGMMIDSLAHVNMIKKNKPNLKFSITAIPAKDGYTGKRGMTYASWGVGISANTKHKDAAWKLISYLLSKDANAKLCNLAKAFPGNTDAVPDFVKNDELFKKAFEIWKASKPANEFSGLPVSEKLMREFDEQFQKFLSGDIDSTKMLENVQNSWSKEF